MKEPCIDWEPENCTPLSDIEACITPLVRGRGGVTIMRNGTLLFIKKAEDDVQSARLALKEAKYLVDFRVKKLSDGGFLVAMHGAVAVFVGEQEFCDRREEIVSRLDDLKFPGESVLVPDGWSDEEFLVGMYGRGKLQRDVRSVEFYKRVD